MRLFNFVVLLIFSTITIHAQDRTITGVVSESGNGPLPGVNILVKGTTNGDITDFDGQYTIKTATNDILVFSHVGYETQEIKIKATDTILNVTLVVNQDELDEVVVVGYGVRKMTSVTAAISSVSSKELRRSRRKRSKNVNAILQGQANGVMTKASKPEVRIRGLSTSNNQTHLYIIDGKVATQEEVSRLNPSSIASIDVIKDASATAIYGSRASHGCIVVKSRSIPNNESYDEIKENTFKQPYLAPLSTFSIDVDKASYSNVRRMINAGQQIPEDAVKVEEMINYFNYDYAQPTDEHPFAIHTEVGATPWNTDTHIVRIGLQGKTYANEKLPASNLVFLIDVSGSMNSPNKLGLLKSAYKLLVNQLREKDKVAIVVYAGAAGVVLPPTSGANKQKILAALDNLEAGGSTAGGAGIKLAYKMARKNFIKNGNNRVILATDGDFNVGASSDSAMQKLIEKERESGVFLSVLGFGYGNYKDSKLETLADKGNGNHAYIDTMQEAQKVFGKEFGGTLYTIAKDVKIQVEFNPNNVQAYRLIGYENRLLNDEDFVDDTKDAGELGSGHTVTALYEIVPVGVKSSYCKGFGKLKYTDIPKIGKLTDELLTVKFRYKKPKGSVSTELVKVVKMPETATIAASEDFKFASAVALFGLQLRKSAFTNHATLNDAIALAESGRGSDREGYRAELIRLMRSYKSL